MTAGGNLQEGGCGRSHSEKRKSILEAAADVFCREGFSGANIDLVAAEAGVSRQTVYNHHGDKAGLFRAVVSMITERMNAEAFAVLATFPDRPADLPGELTEFAVRMARGCLCSRDGRFLRRLLTVEGERFPELFAGWHVDGPAKTNTALAARLARLALSGHLALDDPDSAARHFQALVLADLQIPFALGGCLSDDEIRGSAQMGVAVFLRAYAPVP